MQKQQQQQQKQLSDAIDSGAVKEFLIDDPLHFFMLEQSAKQQQLRQQQQPQYAAAPSNASGASGAGGPFTLTLDEHKRKVEAGYVSLNDSYTACSSVYGVGSSTSSGAAGHDSGNSADLFAGSDLRTAKIGHMMTAAATAAVAASHSAKSTTVRSGPIIL